MTIFIKKVIFRKCLISTFFLFWKFPNESIEVMVQEKNGGIKRINTAVKKSTISLKVLSDILKNHGRHSMLSFLSSLLVSVKCILDDEVKKFYDKGHHLYEAALLTRCYTQHALRPFIDSEVNHKRYFIKIPFINKGINFIDLPSIFRDRSVISSIPDYFKK